VSARPARSQPPAECGCSAERKMLCTTGQMLAQYVLWSRRAKLGAGPFRARGATERLEFAEDAFDRHVRGVEM
jgi:hypothetical protein